ncbi:hypothetical protein M758_1G328900 [Ceratodon purpureus]|nr:hypothetical protein M758_1G328900 [Ceratodon purpureus]
MSHNRIVEILGPTFSWEGQTSETRAEVFQSCLDNPHQLRAGWEKWRGKAKHDIMDWNPGMYLPGSEHLRIYCTYYPLIINRANNRKVVCFNSNRILQHAPIISIAPREWMNMPTLDFLPPDVDDIIAGAAGLLIVNGGKQPQVPNPDNKQTPMLDPDSTAPAPSAPPHPEGTILTQSLPLEDFPEQSIIVACNPLQRDYHTLPRMAHFKMHNKTARMVLVETEPAEVCDWRKMLRPNRRHPDYRLYVIGSEKVESGTLEPDTEEIALFTYDSRVDAWVCCSSQRDARLPPHGRTDIAIVGDGLYFGGQVRTDQSVRRKGGKTESTWVSKIFYIEISRARWNQISFAIPDFDNPGQTLDCQAPRVMQCQVDGRIFIATRPLNKPNVIQVWELEIYSKLPTGRFKYVTHVPHEYFYVMFGRIKSHMAWDCSAGRNYLAFVPTYDERMPEVCMYEVDKDRWNFSRRPRETSKMAKYRLARAEWMPWFAAPRPEMKDMRRECACLDRLNPVVFNPVKWVDLPLKNNNNE